jgi:hypothetical protein
MNRKDGSRTSGDGPPEVKERYARYQLLMPVEAAKKASARACVRR